MSCSWPASLPRVIPPRSPADRGTHSASGWPLVDSLNADADRQLSRSACYHGDGAEVVPLLFGRAPGLLLQQATEGLLVALAGDAAGAQTLTRDLIEPLN
jgi:hypothetical protein